MKGGPIHKIGIPGVFEICIAIQNMHVQLQLESPDIHILYERISISYKLLLSFYLKQEYLKITIFAI